MKRKTKVINFFAGPGSGKSTIAAGLFYELKMSQISCELVREYPKELTWAKNFAMLKKQDLVVAEQHRRQAEVVTQVDWIITDGPLLQCLLYVPKHLSPKLDEHIVKLFHQYDNVNFFIERVKAYDPAGRNQTEDEARDIDCRTYDMLNTLKINYVSVPGNREAVKTILSKLNLAPVVS